MFGISTIDLFKYLVTIIITSIVIIMVVRKFIK
nr:MAG TPA: hypothetical protein [Caudoviricetes sp.]